MDNVVSLKTYKAQKGIALPRSPYYTLRATPEQIEDAVRRASEFLNAPMNVSGRTPYAVLIGYEDKQGWTRLLKGISIYPSKQMLEACVGRRGMKAVFLVNRNQIV